MGEDKKITIRLNSEGVLKVFLLGLMFSLTAAMGSIPCQKRWLRSKFTPISGPIASRKRSSVSGL